MRLQQHHSANCHTSRPTPLSDGSVAAGRERSADVRFMLLSYRSRRRVAIAADGVASSAAAEEEEGKKLADSDDVMMIGQLAL